MVEKITLTEMELKQRLKELNLEWKTGENEKGIPYIERTFHAKNFMDGIDFVHQVAVVAETENHHPDIFINYKRITVRYWTHSSSGVTLADVQMAQKINPMFKKKSTR